MPETMFARDIMGRLNDTISCKSGSFVINLGISASYNRNMIETRIPQTKEIHIALYVISLAVLASPFPRVIATRTSQPSDIAFTIYSSSSHITPNTPHAATSADPNELHARTHAIDQGIGTDRKLKHERSNIVNDHIIRKRLHCLPLRSN